MGTINLLNTAQQQASSLEAPTSPTSATSPLPISTSPKWNSKLIEKYDLSGPRYTSYPTAMQFHEGLNESQWLRAVDESNQSGAPISLYLHIPFCDTVCYYCACNRIITGKKSIAKPYVENLIREIAMQAKHIDTRRPVEHIHWGGGTPSFLENEDIERIVNALHQHFTILPNDKTEHSIEIHPARVDPSRIRFLRKLCFNRLSMGIQDFDPKVQQAVNRFNSIAEVERLVTTAREMGFASINMDLIYGLPHQTEASFLITITQINKLRPERISLFNYAHMPHRFKTQKHINSEDLPAANVKLDILHSSIDALTTAGYVYIGMDHFALPDDELSIAQKNETLHRNFQGYSSHPNCDLFSFGASAISDISNHYFQNAKTLTDYNSAIESDHLAIDRGVSVDEDDQIRRAVINQIICLFKCDYKDFEKAFGIRFESYFKREIEAIRDIASDGLIAYTSDGFKVLSEGRLLVRRICMVFDRHLGGSSRKEQLVEKRYSKII